MSAKSKMVEIAAANLQYPGGSIWLDSSTSAVSHRIPESWRGKFVEVTGVGTAVYMRTDPTPVTISIANETTVANDDDADGLLASGGASALTAQVISGAAFNGIIDEADIDPPRRVSLVLSSHANWDATVATVFGTNDRGEQITDTITIPDGGNSSPATTKAFASVSSISIPAQSGASGTFTVGVLDSQALTLLGTEPHCYGADGVTRPFRIKDDDEFFNHIEGTASQHILITLAEGLED